MVTIKLATAEDSKACLALDWHIDESMFAKKVATGEYFKVENDGALVGVMRYNLFWDEFPFLNLIYLAESERGKGTGKAAMLLWEQEMKRLGYELVMTSTMAEESAQHFYHKLGYTDSGCLIKNTPPLCENAEIFLMKSLIAAE